MSANQAERACRAWPILTATAVAQTSITYGALAQQLGVHHRAIRFVLGVIQDYCLTERLPPLTIVVVNQANGLPGEGFIAWDADDLDTGLAQVYAFGWQAITNPFGYAAGGETIDDLVDQLEKRPSTAGDVFARVRVRGVAQVVFRNLLLRLYGKQCAFCRLTFEVALQASHIIPWPQASAQQRLDPTNGILLCSVHHRLFDDGLMTISPTGRICYYDPKGKDGPYTAADRQMTISLHGQQAQLPATKRHQPGVDSLKHHHKEHGWGQLS